MNGRAFLVLADKEVYPGFYCGLKPFNIDELQDVSPINSGSGEVVFNTAMSGYHEVISDPSYTSQIVVFTYPHIGNYGSLNDWDENELFSGAPRNGYTLSGIVTKKIYGGPVPSGRKRFVDVLLENNTLALEGVDTRALTLNLRKSGSKNGLIICPRSGFNLTKEELEDISVYIDNLPAMEGLDLTKYVGTKTITTINSTGSPHVLILDYGIKSNTIRLLKKAGCSISIVPSKTNSELIEKIDPDCVLLSNGPGDPASVSYAVDCIRKIVGKYPIFGICLGHQLLAIALGAETYKMKFGHHGVNHPVKDLKTGKVIVTSQNHGFAVVESTLPTNTSVWFKNANDHTVEGIVNHHLDCCSVQFHPEAAPGPRDTEWIINDFICAILARKTST
jgi:carbamoyl-phosphate synthase small subunit